MVRAPDSGTGGNPMEPKPLEHKLTAILYADVAGYSRLTGEDEEATHRALSAYLDAIKVSIENHNGIVLHFAGDAVLSDFATVSGALICAVAIQQDLQERNNALPDERKVQFRVGVNLGEVIVDRNEIYGDGVNIAARLESLAEPGGICISESVHTAVGNKLPLDYEFIGERAVKNIAKPVRAYSARLKLGATLPAPSPRKTRWPMRHVIAAAATASVFVIGSVAIVWLTRESHPIAPVSQREIVLPLSDKPSIAVLPFINMSNDPNQEYFADGITEDLNTELSKISGLFVIARNSAFSYKGKTVKPKEVARELGVRYIVEGSVRRAGDQVRINAQLIDTTTAGQVWAERYDGSLTNVFTLQEKVTQKIVAALAVNLSPQSKTRRAQTGTDNPQAYDVFLKGWEHYRLRTPEHYIKAREYFEQAIDLDPGYSRAFAALASIYWKSHYEGWPTPDMIRDSLTSFKVIQRMGLVEPGFGAYSHAKEYLAVAMVNPTPLAHQVAAHISLWQGRHEEAIAEAKRAIALDINDADSYVTLAEVLIFSGAPQQALKSIEYARRLDPYNEAYHSYLAGVAEFQMGQFESATAALERAMELNPELLSFRNDIEGPSCLPCTPLAAAYTYLGREQDAKAIVQRMRALRNTSNVDYEMMWWPYKEAEDRDRLAKGLLEAGLPKTLSDIR